MKSFQLTQWAAISLIHFYQQEKDYEDFLNKKLLREENSECKELLQIYVYFTTFILLCWST